jgi:hypothetical protein
VRGGTALPAQRTGRKGEAPRHPVDAASSSRHTTVTTVTAIAAVPSCAPPPDEALDACSSCCCPCLQYMYSMQQLPLAAYNTTVQQYRYSSTGTAVRRTPRSNYSLRDNTTSIKQLVRAAAEFASRSDLTGRACEAHSRCCVSGAARISRSASQIC